MSLIDDYKLAGALFGGKTIQPTGTGYLTSDTYTLYGVAQYDSSNGVVSVLLDNYDPDNPQPTTCSTSVSVKSGDRVLVSVSGYSYSVTSVIGGGDRMQGEIDNAAAAATNAAAAATNAEQQAALANDKLNTQALYQTFDETTGVTIGKTDSAFKTIIDNTHIGFTQDGTEVASVNANQIDITNANVIYSLRLGNFMFIPRSNGNTTFKWVG